jgi:hypothetical protein
MGEKCNSPKKKKKKKVKFLAASHSGGNQCPIFFCFFYVINYPTIMGLYFTRIIEGILPSVARIP